MVPRSTSVRGDIVVIKTPAIIETLEAAAADMDTRTY